MAFGPGGNGQWVRTRTKAGRKSFLDEKRMERDRALAAQERQRLFWHRLSNGVRRVLGKPERELPELSDRLYVSQEQIAHCPGCPQLDGDSSTLETISADAAAVWKSIGHGYPVATDRPDLEATARCPDCETHGPWR